MKNDQVAVRRLKDVVMTAIDPEVRQVVYLGIAEAMIASTDLTDTTIPTRDLFISAVDELGEIVVLHKDELVNLLSNIAKTRLSLKEQHEKTTSQNYLEFLGITKYLSLADFEKVNKHFNKFIEAYNAVNVLVNVDIH